MRNIAIFVSGEGASTERIVNLFNEGNRLRTVLVVMSDSAADLTERLEDKDINLLHVSDTEWFKQKDYIATLLREGDIRLLVVDHFTLPIEKELIEAAGGKMIEVSSPDLAPREVVGALESDLRRPKEERVEEVEENDEKTPDQEWAETLKINFIPPKVPNTPPPVPEENDQTSHEVAPEMPATQHSNNVETRETHEPMPSTYLIWSVLCTVFCCFIPGIVAIIFSSQVSSKYYAGDLEGSKKSSRMAEIWIIVSVVIGVVVDTLYFPFMLMGN